MRASLPSGARRRLVQAPPGRTSIWHAMVVKPCGPHQRAAIAWSVQARNTRSRGASNSRVITSSRSLGVMTGSALAAAGMRLSFPLDLTQVVVETIEAGVPELAVVRQPVDRGLERAGLEPARPPLRGAAARDQAG